ncbi:MAG: hypothetical protein ABJN36_09560 [Cyclobacteriaceae bacterium]
MKIRNTEKQFPRDEVGRTPDSIMAVDERDSPNEVGRKAVWPYAIAHVTHRISSFKSVKLT